MNKPKTDLRSIKNGALVTIQEYGAKNIHVFDASRLNDRMFSRETVYIYCGTVYHAEDISPATQEDLDRAIRDANAQRDKLVESLRKAYAITRGLK